MKKLILSLMAPLILLSCSKAPDPAETPIEAAGKEGVSKTLSLVPLPQQVVRLDGVLSMPVSLSISADEQASASYEDLTALLGQLNIDVGENANAFISLKLISDDALGQEGYRLKVDKTVQIKAQTDTGLFYGVQTLRQLLPAVPASSYSLPKIDITDKPQYPWRGSMLDVARNFLSADYLKQHIVRMSRFKLNKLHLHLTDDQGWRIEIKSRPRLTEVASAISVSGKRGGFYTQEEMKDVVAFAAKYHVELIPEIDIPGHTQSAIAAYNELACDDVMQSPPQNNCEDVVGDARLSTYSGICVGFSALCSSKKPDLVYSFVTDVLTEIAEIFPSQYLHIGGDEVLNEEAAAFPAFITRTDDIVASLGKTLVAWEEASKGTLRPQGLLQFWNDNYDIQSALDNGNHLILSPCSYTYLDHGNYEGQPDTYTWCAPKGIPLERVYALVPENYDQVVGVEGPMWSEKVDSDAVADNRKWPRLIAIAEVSWTEQPHRDYDSFVRRLSPLQAHLDALGVQYHRAKELNW